jgi:hypothetical protein
MAGDGLHDAARAGAELAALTLQTDRSVRADLSPELLDRQTAARSL